MNQGGFDIVTASGDASLRLIAGETVQEINTDLIPSWSTIDEETSRCGLAYCRWQALWHSIHAWGSNVLMFNTEAFGGDKVPDSWNVVFEEQILADGQEQ
jgi:putative spermidine/putrescine transport system substrate-binding protein